MDIGPGWATEDDVLSVLNAIIDGGASDGAGVCTVVVAFLREPTKKDIMCAPPLS